MPTGRDFFVTDNVFFNKSFFYTVVRMQLFMLA